jgi:hypothetical protein
MTLPTDAKVERLARAYCVARGMDPDAPALGLGYAGVEWQHYGFNVRDFLIMARCAKAEGLV